MASKVYTAALIGCGRIGYSLGLDKKREQPASHTMALNDNPRIHLVAGCDIDSAALNQWHEANKKALVYKDSANLYARQKLDIITVAVNENAHQKEAVNAIVSGPSLVILEKPVALNMAEALRIRDEAEKNHVPVLVNHERRFSEDYLIAKDYLSTIGDIQSIHASLYSSLSVYNPREEASGAYSLIHDGTHLVDAVLFFLENSHTKSTFEEVRDYDASIASVSGLLKKAKKATTGGVRYKNSILHDPVITGLYKDESDCVRQASVHYSTPECPDVTLTFSGRSKYFGFEIEITGTEGRIRIGNGIFELYHREKSHLYTGFYSLMPGKNVHVPKKTMYFANMVKNAVDFLDGKAELKSTLDTGINALVVLEEIKSKF